MLTSLLIVYSRNSRSWYVHDWSQQPLGYTIFCYLSSQLSCFFTARCLFVFCELIYFGFNVSYSGCSVFEDHSRYLHFYGEAHARLERDCSIYRDHTNEYTMFIRILAPFLFLAPYVHHRALKDVWVDGILHPHDWEEVTETLKKECKALVLLVRVIFFIDIPSRRHS